MNPDDKAHWLEPSPSIDVDGKDPRSVRLKTITVMPAREAEEGAEEADALLAPQQTV
jgi:hypothetical protein